MFLDFLGGGVGFLYIRGVFDFFFERGPAKTES